MAAYWAGQAIALRHQLRQEGAEQADALAAGKDGPCYGQQGAHENDEELGQPKAGFPSAPALQGSPGHDGVAADPPMDQQKPGQMIEIFMLGKKPMDSGDSPDTEHDECDTISDCPSVPTIVPEDLE